MLQMKKKYGWWQLAILCIVMIVIVGLPASTSSAKSVSKRELLGNSITYCGKMDKSEYTSKTWKAFQKELKEAKAVYKKTKEANSVYVTARNELETAKANLVFVSSKDKGNPLPFRALTADQMVDEMGTGWNLGNTMDGFSDFVPSETAWQSVVTTKELIKTVHDMGFNTLRIPVSWMNMIDDSNDYAINDAWISRVQDIVDYGISQGMYVIINIHHDGAGGWLNISSRDIDSVYEKYEHVWRNIAERFKDYDEHLIFESMNEVMYASADEGNKIIGNFNQIFTNVVRSTGSNNRGRWLSVPGRYANIETTAQERYGFDIPADTIANRIFVSVHDYDFNFGLTEDMKVTSYSYTDVTNLADRYKLLYDRFTSKGIPVILGEYGAVNKSNTAERAYYYEAVTRICKRYGIVACAWDHGYFDETRDPDYSFTIIDRAALKPYNPDIVNAIMRGTYLTSKVKDYSDLVKSPKITQITSITLSDTDVSMKIGDSKEITVKVKPSKTNDVVLWKSADANIATVSNGYVRARGIGTTTLTAFSQSGSVMKEVAVTVTAKESSDPCTEIKTDSNIYHVAKGGYLYLNISLKPANTDDSITFVSSDESVATVSALGKVVGVAEGTATITIAASNGLTATIEVNVESQ